MARKKTQKTKIEFSYLFDRPNIFDLFDNDLPGTEIGLSLRALAHRFPRLDRQWKWIGEQADHSNQFKRIGALATAVGAFELALAASGLKPDPRHKAHVTVGDLNWPTEDEFKNAYIARHRAVHNLIIPNRRDCIKHIAVLYRGWHALRSQFVTKENAGRLASMFLGLKYVSSVMLFGSLARGHPDPGDIDLLLFDNGALSSMCSEYGTLRVNSL